MGLDHEYFMGLALDEARRAGRKAMTRLAP